MLTIILYVLLAAFGIGDGIAHLTRYKYGPTVSWTIWWLEKRYPAARVVVGAGCLALFLHLALHLF